MNPGMFFREVLESHLFRRSDIRILEFRAVILETAHVSKHITFTSDKANLLDIIAKDRVGRYKCYFLE